MMQPGGPPGSQPPPPPIPPPAEETCLPFALYEALLDIPYPGASSSAPVEVIYPPPTAAEGGGEIIDAIPSEVLHAEFGEEGSHEAVQGVAKIARFAFPEYEDSTNAQEVAQRQASGALGANLNRHDAYLEEVFALSASANSNQATSGYYSAANVPTTFAGSKNIAAANLSTSLPSYHVFCHRLANGTVIHGHVRRYLPHHAQAGGRRDVGRRGVRALVILTRISGGGHRLYSGLLKTLDVLNLQSAALSQNVTAAESDVLKSGQQENVATDASSGLEYRRWFMHSVFREHLNICRTVAAAKANNDGSNKQPILTKPRIITIPLVELGRGHGLFGSVDTVKFAVPSSFLHSRESTSPISGMSRNDMMPMLRCLGVVRAMRLLSALMSERRIIFTSNNVSKLSAVSYGAVAMLGQGLLSPPPVFVPVLAPGLVSLLQSPSAYLIGVLIGPTPNFINLRNHPNIGQVVVFDLDSDETEPYYHNIDDPHQFVPDLTRRNFDDMDAGNRVSLPDNLYQDIAEALKTDKKLFWQGAVQERLGLVASKGKTVAKAAMKKGLEYFKSKGAKDSMESKAETEDDAEEEVQQNESPKGKLVGKGIYLYEQGYPNETAEVEARIAFSNFFISLLGDLRSYLTQNAPGTPPVVDKANFMKRRAQSGDSPGTAMWLLLGNFMRSKLFDEFAGARLRELQMRRAVAEDAPLFALVTNYHRSNKIDFYVNNVRQSVQQIASDSSLPGRYLVSWNEGVRRRVLDLTSQAFNGDPQMALTQLIEDCRETGTILVDTMMVLWTRIQEGKGLQWKKTLLALQIFLELLLNGPINAVAEAIDGFASIRLLKSYTEALRGQNSALIRVAASEIYSLLVDLSVLFARRRVCMNKRWLLNNPKPSPFRKETRMMKGIAQFRHVHNALRPAGARVAPAPSPAEDLLQCPTAAGESAPNNSNGAPQPETYSNDLLSINLDVSQPSHQQTNVNSFNMTAISNAVTALPQNPSNYPPHYSQQVVQQHQLASTTPQLGQRQLMQQLPVYQQQFHQQQTPQQQPSMIPQNQPNGGAFLSPQTQTTQQTPQQLHQQPYPPQLQHRQSMQHQQSFSNVAYTGYQQPVTQQQQGYPHFAPGSNQTMYAQNPSPSHLSQSAPPPLLPGQTGQQQPPLNPPKKVMNFDPFA